jgi:hypothetical protein
MLHLRGPDCLILFFTPYVFIDRISNAAYITGPFTVLVGIVVMYKGHEVDSTVVPSIQLHATLFKKQTIYFRRVAIDNHQI